jgi:hypothetical protein
VTIAPKNAVWLAANKANGGKTILHVDDSKEIYTTPLFFSPFSIFFCLTMLNSFTVLVMRSAKEGLKWKFLRMKTASKYLIQ